MDHGNGLWFSTQGESFVLTKVQMSGAWNWLVVGKER